MTNFKIYIYKIKYKMENEILEVERERQEILKRIQEKERLINLIQSKHVKGEISELMDFQNRYNIKKEKEEHKKEEDINKFSINKNIDLNLEQDQNNVELNEKELATFKFKSFQQGVNYIAMIKKLQRAYRKYILNKKRKELRNRYMNILIGEFYRPITLERGVELRKILKQRLEQWKALESEYDIILNKYYKEYKQFCLSFPEVERLREDNFFIYYQSLDLLNYMESMNPETALKDCNLFNKFVLDKNKEFSTKLIIDEMEKQYKYKNDVYQYNVIDEFEENNLLDEIDNRYNFESRHSILNKK